MLTEPITLTVNAVAKNLPAVSREPEASVYRSEDGVEANLFRQVKVSHQHTSQRHRRLVRLDLTRIAADPLTSDNMNVSASVYLVIDEPLSGWTDTELDYEVQALFGFLSTSNVGKILGGES